MKYGKTEPTFEQWQQAEEAGLNRNTVRLRLMRGWPIQRAVTEPAQKRRRIHIKKEWVDRAAANGIGYNTLHKRLTRAGGWSVEDACTRPVRQRAAPFTEEQLQTMARNGVSPRQARQRMSDCGWSLFTAITTPIGRNPEIK